VIVGGVVSNKAAKGETLVVPPVNTLLSGVAGGDPQPEMQVIVTGSVLVPASAPCGVVSKTRTGCCARELSTSK
jgi:hypothetical protein